MGVVQHRQIRQHLEANYLAHIELADYAARPDTERLNAGLSRALAAFAIASEADLSPDIAGNTVVDGFNDNGIDAVFYSAAEKILYASQAKWSNDGTGSIDQASAEKLIRGVRDLLNLRFERFNDKVRRRQNELEAAVNNTTRVVIITAHAGSDRIGDHPRRVLSDFLTELNDTGEVAAIINLTQENFYSIVSQGGRGEPVNLTVQLFDWGQTKEPYMAFYGQLAASDLADWGAKFRQRLFSKNIRSFLGGSTAVNEAVADSIRNAPTHFWYFNNGITVLCGSIKKRPIGGGSHDAGTFDCDDIAIVNGAQTVGVISELGPSLIQQLRQARVPIRLISLEGCPPGFAMEVTRATNTQNRVDSRNFVALDPEQDRLRAELLVDGIDYEYRQGEGEPGGPTRFGLIDATVALACSQVEVDLAVQAKREISKLWEDLGRAPYKLMFNGSLPGLRLWHLVQMLRVIDVSLEKAKSQTSTPKAKNLVIHANRLLAHLVFRRVGTKEAGTADFNARQLPGEIETATRCCIDNVVSIVERDYDESYLASLFKNAAKCRDIGTKVKDLFDATEFK